MHVDRSLSCCPAGSFRVSGRDAVPYDGAGQDRVPGLGAMPGMTH